MNNKGSAFTDLFILLAVLMVSVLFLGGFLYSFGLLSNEIGTIKVQSDYFNITSTGEKTFDRIDTGIQGLQWVAFGIFFGMAIAILISNFLVKAHPVFFIIYIMLAVVSVIFSAYISNAYEDILTGDNALATPLQQDFGVMNFVISQLPIFITVIAFLGALFLFIGIRVDREAGGGLE